ncbi:MAG: hypothetical protein ACOCWZ_00480 [Spirochaetota bacterium]
MILIILFILLQVSFTVHIYNLIIYVLKKNSKNLRWFVNTAITNILIAGSLTVLAIFEPRRVRGVDIDLLIWIMTGLIMLAMLGIKINIFRNIYQRSKDPENYHFNYFGKKVLHSSVVRYEEILIFMFTMPFFLFAGAYFIARLVNLVMFDHL